MKAMLLRGIASLAQNPNPLSLEDIPQPTPKPGEVLIRISACGVCHTELDEIEGRTPPPELPVVLGHQAVGVVVEQIGENRSNDFSRSKTGENRSSDFAKHPERVSRSQATKVATTLKIGDRVGVAWIFSACGECEYCRSGRENLCKRFQATGRDANGGYAEYMTVPAAFAHPIPAAIPDAEAAPLLCAGAIGYRSLRLANLQDGRPLGLMGFGGSNHLVLKMAKHLYPNSDVYVFSRSRVEQDFARSLGAAWAGGISDLSPRKLSAVIDTTPVWKPVVEGLKCLDNGGRLVINAIRKETTDQDALLHLDYPSHLWMEKEIKSVANVTRADVREFLQLAAEADIRPEIEEFPLADANRALLELRQGKIRGAKVLRVE